MSTDEQTSWRDDFTEAQQSFATWRDHRQRGARIPAALWEAALSLAERHGVAKTATTLRLDYYALKRRLAPESVAAATATGAAAEPSAEVVGAIPRFVEVSLGAGPSTISCTLEVEGQTPTRSKLRLELQGIGLADLNALLRSVWSQSA